MLMYLLTILVQKATDDILSIFCLGFFKFLCLGMWGRGGGGGGKHPPGNFKNIKAMTMKPRGHMVCKKLSPLWYAHWNNEVV